MRIRELLAGVPPTAPDNVVTLEPDQTRAPPVLGALYTEIKILMRDVGAIDAAIAETELAKQSAIEAADAQIRKAQERRRERVAALHDAQTRWVMITRDLGIEIEEDGHE